MTRNANIAIIHTLYKLTYLKHFKTGKLMPRGGNSFFSNLHVLSLYEIKLQRLTNYTSFTLFHFNTS